MGFYSTKFTNYGYKEKVTVYEKPIAYGEDAVTPTADRQKYENMTELEKKKSNERHIRFYRKRVSELTGISLMNTDLCTAVTLTFRDSVTSYDYALAKWQSFLKRLRHHIDKPLKYICVWEYQQARSKKEGIEDGGIFHFHCLMNIGFIEHGKLEKLWGNGYVWIEHLGDEYQRMKAIRYTMKYITKEVIENASDRGKRYTFTSNNLLKPKVAKYEEKANLDDVIFAHMEDMIKENGFDLKDYNGKIINHADYVEYKM